MLTQSSVGVGDSVCVARPLRPDFPALLRHHPSRLRDLVCLSLHQETERNTSSGSHPCLRCCPAKPPSGCISAAPPPAPTYGKIGFCATGTPHKTPRRTYRERQGIDQDESCTSAIALALPCNTRCTRHGNPAAHLQRTNISRKPSHYFATKNICNARALMKTDTETKHTFCHDGSRPSRSPAKTQSVAARPCRVIG